MPVKTEDAPARPKKETVTYLSNAGVMINVIPSADPKIRGRSIVFTEIPKRLRDQNIVLDNAQYYYVLVPDDPNYWEIRDYIEGRPVLNAKGEQEQDDNYGPAWASDKYGRKLEPNILWQTTIWTEASKRNQLIEEDRSRATAEREGAIRLWASLHDMDLEKARRRLDGQKRLTPEINAENDALLKPKEPETEESESSEPKQPKGKGAAS